ncbi:uncharacterized protein LOC117651037 [Thrips palmi]|uniref:DNA-directed DNA polymerase n=1 Tax=Thrips palmi TaxID=161013 RepID=A0A6P8ZYY6_THRPL|nr:uncharacterized protein LOC117651037 [Thrips palmi]
MNRFRSMIYKKYGLEVHWFVSASSLSMCCMYKFTGAVVERVSDPQMHALLSSGVRGGYAGVHQRYSEANIPGTPTYKPEEPEKHILLFDVNALYSHMMQKPLSVGDYKWMSQQELDGIKWEELSEEDEHMCIVSVDLSVPRHLRSRLDEFPPAVEKCKVPPEWYSNVQRDMIRDCGLKKAQLSEEKLVAHLHPKKNYLVHALVLAAYIKMGVRVDAIHSGIRFRQAPYLRPYIQDLMTERQNAQYKFQQDVWKIFANVIYGQLLMNPRLHRKVDLVRTGEEFRKLAAQSTFKSFTIFADELVAVERAQSVVRMNNLPTAGLTVLDTSKKLMMEIYSELKNKLGSRMKLLVTDTDSLGVEIETSDLVADLRSLMPILDTSGLPKDHPLYDQTYARVQGRLKIEYGHFNILRFCGVRAKVYSLDVAGVKGERSVVMKCKGVNKSALRRTVTFDDYKNCVMNGAAKYVKSSSILTDRRHNLFTVAQTKSCLRNFDGKRYILDCGIKTHSYGYDPLREGEQQEKEDDDNNQMFWEDMDADVAAQVDQAVDRAEADEVEAASAVAAFLRDDDDDWGEEALGLDPEMIDALKVLLNEQ